MRIGMEGSGIKVSRDNYVYICEETAHFKLGGLKRFNYSIPCSISDSKNVLVLPYYDAKTGT